MLFRKLFEILYSRYIENISLKSSHWYKVLKQIKSFDGKFYFCFVLKKIYLLNKSEFQLFKLILIN